MPFVNEKFYNIKLIVVFKLTIALTEVKISLSGC